jgi:hypothetical protein
MLFCAPRTDRTEEAVPVQNNKADIELPPVEAGVPAKSSFTWSSGSGLAALRGVRSFCHWLFAATLAWRVAPVPGVLLSGPAGSELISCTYEVGVTGGGLAVRQQQGVFEADAGVDATSYCVLDEDPGCLAVAVLKSRSPYAGPVKDVVDGAHQGHGIEFGDVDRLNHHACHATGQSAAHEQLGILYGPHPGLDAYPGRQECLHDLNRS